MQDKISRSFIRQGIRTKEPIDQVLQAIPLLLFTNAIYWLYRHPLSHPPFGIQYIVTLNKYYQECTKRCGKARVCIAVEVIFSSYVVFFICMSLFFLFIVLQRCLCHCEH